MKLSVISREEIQAGKVENDISSHLSPANESNS